MADQSARRSTFIKVWVNSPFGNVKQIASVAYRSRVLPVYHPNRTPIRD